MLEAVVRNLGHEEVEQQSQLLGAALPERTIQPIPLYQLLNQRDDNLRVSLFDCTC